MGYSKHWQEGESFRLSRLSHDLNDQLFNNYRFSGQM